MRYKLSLLLPAPRHLRRAVQFTVGSVSPLRQANERQRWVLYVEQLLVKRVDALRRRGREQTRPFQERKGVAVAGAPHNGVHLHRQDENDWALAPLEPLRVPTVVNN